MRPGVYYDGLRGEIDLSLHKQGVAARGTTGALKEFSAAEAQHRRIATMDPDQEREHVRRQLVDACQALAPTAAADLGLETEAERTRLVELCIAMFNAGIRAGAVQAVAQAVEQGVDVRVNMDPSLLPPAG